MEKRIEVIITNQDFAETVEFTNQTENPLLVAVKRAFFENDVKVGDLRFGSYNINSHDAQIGKFDKPFHDHDYQILLNKFLKGIPFKEKRVITLFAEPQKFRYPAYTIVEDEHADKSNPVESTPENSIKIPFHTSLLVGNEVMELLMIPCI